jgi:hypothetical protein
MTSKRKPKHVPQEPTIEANISGNISGQIAIGSNIHQTQTAQGGVSGLTKDELTTLTELIGLLKEKVASEAPPDKKESALEKVSDLEDAIVAEKPDISTMEHVRNWFVKNIPSLAGAVTGLVVNPIVGKLVEAAGETIAHEFKRHFGSG